MHSLIPHFLRLIEHYGLAGIFVSMLIENCGIPLPTEGAFLVAQGLILRGEHSFWFLYWFIVYAHVVGAVIAYGIGVFAGHSLEKRLSRSEKYHKVSNLIRRWYAKNGTVIVLATRLIGYIRPWSSFVAGFADFPFWPFLLWTVIGTMLLVYPTMKATALLVVVWERYPLLHIFISIGSLLAIFAGVLYYLFHRIRKHYKER